MTTTTRRNRGPARQPVGPRTPDWPPAGAWIAASTVLGQPVSADDPYPHICGAARRGGRDCHACTRNAYQQTVIEGDKAA